MEKTLEQKEKDHPQADMAAKPLPQIWDCGSSLYDSFELKSFERQLDSAIHSRTLSMSHLSDRRFILHDLPPPPPPPPQTSSFSQMTAKKSSKISRSFQKFLRSFFKPKQNHQNSLSERDGGFYAVYDKSAALSTIPEVPEFDGGGLSADIRSSLVRRTASERFTATSIGISCA